MLPTNYDLARMRVEDWHREAAHARLVREAKAARKASRPERPGVAAAAGRAWTALVRALPWTHETRLEAGTVRTPGQLVPAQPTVRRA
jgi:hypothetical protein